ncbi:MAG: hypothetical protein Q4B09_08360 [Lachnospiraceae bacterium]|nr:hypothetical protein [Lachnospiraceae bacterium]
MVEYLEQDRPAFTEKLKAAGTPEAALPVLEAELDRILVRTNDALSDDRERESAARMVGAVRMALPLVDAVGEVDIWSRSAGDRSAGKNRKKSFLLLLAGIALAAVSVIGFLLPLPIVGVLLNTISVLLTAAAMICLYLAGRFSVRSVPAGTAGDTVKTECRIDADRIYRTLRAVLLVMDQNLQQIRSEREWEARNTGEQTAAVLSQAELTLYSDLLEAACSRDSAYAWDKLEELRYYLHSIHVEVVDYSEDTAAWFDRLPSSQTGTLKPALVSGGKLLKKGLAGIGG